MDCGDDDDLSDLTQDVHGRGYYERLPLVARGEHKGMWMQGERDYESGCWVA